MQKVVEKYNPHVLSSMWPKEGAELVSKSVRLWSGMDGGIEQTVRLHCTPESRFLLEFGHGGEIAWLPLSEIDLDDLLHQRDARIDSPHCRCIACSSGDMLNFIFEGVATVQFAMAAKHFQVLVKSLMTPTTAR